ncbi:MAG: DmsE family decaheme c-type cytochrome [Burkholderiales bacterium]|jgi:DmsE family decaheme c-type cytochrome
MRIVRYLLVVVAAALASASAVQAAGNTQDLVLKDDAKCTTCHDENDSPKVLRIGQTRHGTVADPRVQSCTGCHGASEKHIADAEKSVKPPAIPDVAFGARAGTPVAARNGACLACHQGGTRIAWQTSTHASREVACANCHKVHTAHDSVRDRTAQTETCFGCHKEQRAQVNRPSHHPVIEGKMSCSSCHNVHGDNPKQLARASVNETCFTCHMEKRGPFVHNHQPVQEDCAICHNPHGTNAANLLKARPPFLCQECHSHTSHPSQASGLPGSRTTSTSALGSVARGCLNCHVNIHGSNSTQNSATAGRFRR